MHILITFVDHFSNGKEFNTELCTCLLPLVDNPIIPIVVCVNIGMGQLCYVRMAQAREGAKDEGIPVNARTVVGKFDVHHGLQFRSG